MISNLKSWFIGVAVLALVGGGAFFLTAEPSEEQKEITEIAQCIKDSGAIFYGAFWCPHCADQKKTLGGRKFNYNYVECSTIDRRGLTPVCKEEGIQNYPTWKFEDGDVCTGAYSLAALASKAGCDLPDKFANMDAVEYIEHVISIRLPEDATDEQVEQYRNEFYKLLELPAIKDKGLTIETATAQDVIDVELSLRCAKDVPAVEVKNIEVNGGTVTEQNTDENL